MRYIVHFYTETTREAEITADITGSLQDVYDEYDALVWNTFHTNIYDEVDIFVEEFDAANPEHIELLS